MLSDMGITRNMLFNKKSVLEFFPLKDTKPDYLTEKGKVIQIDEIFVSIQGEGTQAGKPCIFIRTFGCSVGCTYCDQPQMAREVISMSVNKIVSVVEYFHTHYGVTYVCITGGEPLQQYHIYDLIDVLLAYKFTISVETSGCFPIEKNYIYPNFWYVMDIKCPSSNVSHKNLFDNLKMLGGNQDEVKFVIGTREDYEYMKDVLSIHRDYFDNLIILVSPMFSIEEGRKNEILLDFDLVESVLRDGLDCRIILQTHKFLGAR